MSKNDFIEYSLGDLFDYLLSKFKLSPMLLPVLGLTALVYYLYIKKHKKGTKYTKVEKFYIGRMIFMWILAIISQIIVITDFSRDYSPKPICFGSHFS